MTMARIQPFCRANDINLGYFDRTRVFLRSVTERNNALFLYNNQFCLIWKSEGISFTQVFKEMKDNFKIFDNYITEENVNSYFKYEFIPKKIYSHLKNFIIYDLRTHNTDRTRPYCVPFYRLSKLAGRYNRDLTPYEIKKCKNDIFVFDGDDCFTKAFEFLLKFKGEERKVKNKIVEYNLQLHAHIGSRFDSWLIIQTFLVINTLLILLKMEKEFFLRNFQWLYTKR